MLAGVSGFTVKAPVKSANFKGDEQLTLTVIDEKGGKAVIRKCLMRNARNWHMWMLPVLKEKEVVRIKQGDPYFVYEVKLSEATRINERMVLDWQRS